MPSPWMPAVRYAVIGWFGLGLIWSIAAPFWLPQRVDVWFASLINFGGPADPDMVKRGLPGVTWWVSMWSAATAVVDVVAIVGAVKRLRWVHVAVLVWLGLWMVLLVLAALDLSTPPDLEPPDRWPEKLVLAFGVGSTLLGGFMIVAGRRTASR